MADNTTEQSVEQALAELKDMFPGRSVGVTALLCPNEFSIAVAANAEYEHFTDNTLNEAMGLVRQWHAEQAKR